MLQNGTCSPLENSHAFGFGFAAPFAFLAGASVFSGFSGLSLGLGFSPSLPRFLASGHFGITCLPASDCIKVRGAGLGGYSFRILIKRKYFSKNCLASFCPPSRRHQCTLTTANVYVVRGLFLEKFKCKDSRLRIPLFDRSIIKLLEILFIPQKTVGGI